MTQRTSAHKAHFILLASLAGGAWLLPDTASAQSAQLPRPIANAIAASEAQKREYAYDIEYSTAAGRFSARFTPGGEPRLKLVAPERERLPAALRTDFDMLQQRVKGVTWCAATLLTHIRDVALVREDSETQTYSFQPTAESVTDDMTRRLANRLRGELVVTKGAAPDVASMRIYAPAPFSPILLANVYRYALTTICAVAPNGRRYASVSVTEIDAAMAGQPTRINTTRRNSNLESVR